MDLGGKFPLRLDIATAGDLDEEVVHFL